MSMKDDDVKPLGRGRQCRFCAEPEQKIDYKDVGLLRQYVTERGKIVPRRVSGLCATHQREAAVGIQRARMIALMPFSASTT